ncbi:MAG: ABC transporter ATP-binding protein, partial [Oscillospiraceae bacterium]|nr:ABC transporter ATP-binding protein [Oscillospiraceae bacterium]
MAVLKIDNLFCGYGRKDIVKGISVTVPAGEILSVIGPNGCGKTTLLKAAAGLLPIRSGGAYIDGQLISEMSHKERARRIALLSQTGTGGDYFDYTVSETIAMGRY